MAPGEGDWDEVVEQVDAALRGLLIHDDRLREALLDGVQQALEAVSELGGGAPPGAEPEVTVIEGGREPEDEPRPDPGGAPSLQVLDGTQEPPPEPRRARVRVIPAQALSGGTLASQGRIRVEEEGWQTVYRGHERRSYRLYCSTGRLEVALDGDLQDRLDQGQSTDVEARLIRVRSPEGTSRGAYVRISR